MRVVNVKLSGVRVNSFSAKDSTVLLEIFFNDGANKQIYRTTRIDNPGEVAEDIIKEIVNLEKNINLEFDGEMIDGNINVNIKDEEQDRRRIAQMLAETQAKIERVRNKKNADGYMQLVAEITRTGLEL